MKNFRSILALGVFAASTTLAAHATPLAVNGYSGPENYGTLISASTVTGTDIPGIVNGGGTAVPFSVSYTISAYVGGTGAECPTCINFVINFSNSANPALTSDDIDLLSLTDFTGFSATEEYIEGSGITPYQVNNIGNAVDFSYANGVLPGQTSDALVIFTNATSYTSGSIDFSEGASVSVPGLEPAGTPVFTPEPNSLVLLGTGLASAAGMVFRRRRSVA